MFKRIVFTSVAMAAMAIFVIGCDGTTSTSEKPAEPAVPPTTTPPADGGVEVPAILEITQGAEVKLAEYAAEGLYTIFDFYSDGCPPCRALKPRVERLANENAGIVLRVVNVNRPGVGGIDWGSPVIKQYRIDSIPHLKVYGQDGRLMLEGDAARAWFEAEYTKLGPAK